MSLLDLLVFNFLLQFFDGFVSYQFFLAAPVEANPIVEAGISSWGVVGGLLYYKTLACALLLLLQALTVTAQPRHFLSQRRKARFGLQRARIELIFPSD
jgi:hypothetical protein